MKNIIFIMVLVLINFGCARRISINEAKRLETENGQRIKYSWLYQHSDGDFHYFTRFYTNMFGGVAYEYVKISVKDIGIKVVVIKPEVVEEGKIGNYMETVVP